MSPLIRITSAMQDSLVNTRRRLIIKLGGNVKKAILGKLPSITGLLDAIVRNAAINPHEMKFVF